MAASKKPASSSLQVRIHFREQQEGESPPTVALYQLDRSGTPEAKVAVADDGVLHVPKGIEQKAVLLALGPDLDAPSDLDRSSLLMLDAADAVRLWRQRPVVELPRLRWTPWWYPIVCVSGTVRKCWFRPPVLPPIPPIWPPRFQIPDLFFPPVHCAPLCNGVVEVHERVCCCDWWEIVPRIPELIPEILPDPPFPDPIPDPWPGPRPLPYEGGLRRIDRAMQAYRAEVEPSQRVPLAPRVANDLRALSQISAPEALYEYVSGRDYLLPVFCRCSSRKVGEASLSVDGSFSFCYPRGLFLRNCTVTYTYVVKQSIGGTWVTVYDGDAANAYFGASEFADLTTFNVQAETCAPPEEPPVDGHGRPFVMLQAIGSTDTHRLHSPAQTSLTAVPGPDNSGLLDQSYSDNCPLARTLNLLLWIDPNLEGLGAEYYRFSLARTTASGAIIGSTLQRLTGSVSWRRWANGVWPPEPENVALGPVAPPTVGGEIGLVRIPYYDNANRWLGNQFHYRLDTRAFANGRYALVVELFDGAGNRLRPNGASGAGTDAAFHYVHWDTPGSTSEVDYAQLVHLLHIDNTACRADIVDLRKGTQASSAECQFLSGDGTDSLRVGYRAYHANQFMLSYDLTYQRGLNGTGPNGTGTLASGGAANQPASMGGGSPAVSSGQSFGHLLGDTGTGPVHAKCTFSLELRARGKHTSGSGRLDSYDAKDDASFALEVD